MVLERCDETRGGRRLVGVAVSGISQRIGGGQMLRRMIGPTLRAYRCRAGWSLCCSPCSRWVGSRRAHRPAPGTPGSAATSTAKHGEHGQHRATPATRKHRQYGKHRQRRFLLHPYVHPQLLERHGLHRPMRRRGMEPFRRPVRRMLRPRRRDRKHPREHRQYRQHGRHQRGTARHRQHGKHRQRRFLLHPYMHPQLLERYGLHRPMRRRGMEPFRRPVRRMLRPRRRDRKHPGNTGNTGNTGSTAANTGNSGTEPATPGTPEVAEAARSATVNSYWSSISNQDYSSAYSDLAPGAVNLTQAQFVSQEQQAGIQSVSFNGHVLRRPARPRPCRSTR